MSNELKNRIITSIFLLGLLTLMFFYFYILIIALIIITIIIWIEFYAMISKIFNKSNFQSLFLKLLLKSVSLLYLSFFSVALILIKSTYVNLEMFLYYSILVAIVSDIGGFFFGKTFKGKKLTKISPKKTISGSIGSFLFSLSLILFFFRSFVDFNIGSLIIITLIISLASQAGDLLISYLKRKANVKNTGDLLPGHGGFLDRVDGILFSVPIGLIIFINF